MHRGAGGSSGSNAGIVHQRPRGGLDERLHKERHVEYRHGLGDRHGSHVVAGSKFNASAADRKHDAFHNGSRGHRSPDHYYKRSRSRRKAWSPRRHPDELAPPTRRPVGYAYGEGRRREHANHETAKAATKKRAPRNALTRVDDIPARRDRAGLKGSPMSDTSMSSGYTSASGDSETSGSPLEDEEEEEEQQKAPQPAEKKEGRDEIVHFSWQKGTMLHDRYELLKALGDGTFGRVVLAYDRCSDREVAIKIIRDVKRYMENAKIEADILKDVRKADPRGASRCAIMYDTFTHESKYFCLVFEPLGVSLYDFMKKNAFRGFWLQDIQDFARQCLKAMKFLHDELRLAHTDLKPENILLQAAEPPRPAFFPREAEWKASQHGSRKDPAPYVRPVSSQIKIIDFGNATYEDEHHSSVINTRQYRGPEVVLELGWNERSDIWSLGCIFIELYSGELLFGTHENLEHLALMEKVIAPLPGHMLCGALSQVKEKYLQQDPQTNAWRLAWPTKASSQASQKHVHNARKLGEIVRARDHQSLVACVGSMLAADPKHRPSAAQVLKDGFFSMHFDD